jgi:hypothetical protein
MACHVPKPSEGRLGRKSPGPSRLAASSSSDLSPPRRATVLGMTALKQLAFSLAFAIAAVAAAQYIMGILNGQP